MRARGGVDELCQTGRRPERVTLRAARSHGGRSERRRERPDRAAAEAGGAGSGTVQPW
jgi:hypothetical protein